MTSEPPTSAPEVIVSSSFRDVDTERAAAFVDQPSFDDGTVRGPNREQPLFESTVRFRSDPPAFNGSEASTMPSELEPRLLRSHDVIDVTVIEGRDESYRSLRELRDDIERLRARLDVAETRGALFKLSLDYAVARTTTIEARLVTLERRMRWRTRALLLLLALACVLFTAYVLSA